MSAANITTKYTATAVTGTSGTTYVLGGRDAQGFYNWRGVLDANVPNSDNVLSTKGGKTANGWNSSTKMIVPIMESIATGDANGYVAAPKRADLVTYKLIVTRPDRITAASAARVFDEFVYALLMDAKLRSEVLGYVPADA
jgi:hypothetical protein